MQRLSIYADDFALFIRPSAQDMCFVRNALHIFGEASDLKVNYAKSSAILIRGDEQDQLRVADVLQCQAGLQELNIQIRTPEPQDTLTEWWLWARGHFRRAERRGFDTLVIITTWALWKQRNARVFNRRGKS
ncbi:Serine/threonine-phosphatase BSL2-like protein [Hordeum vulgare]|nr:Serine/threonine-phosphatase BSL2-like protein [Hordeum vulgare]